MTNKPAKGKRAKTRNKFTKRHGRTTVNKLLQDINVGEKVQLVVDSSIHSAMPPRRFHGSTAIVTGKRGRAFIVELKKGRDSAELIVGPAHLNVLGASSKEGEAR
ncbi:MAG: 50S ribosomal protein L21e [Candidatus Diapherotrites archaeon]